jgi:enoyl-CoA hydratase/carnithine racemase
MSHIHTARQGKALILTMARPARRNALTLAMYDAMTAALHEAAADPDVAAVCLRGEGGAFTSGNDLMDFMQNPPSGQDSPVFRFLQAVLDFPKPLVAAVQGFAIGIGTTVLLHCDLAFADDSATFQMPFVNLALVPEAASSLLLPATMGHRRASELLLLGDRFDAHKAREYGLLNAVWDPADFDQKLADTLTALCERPAESLRLTKQLLKARHRAATQDAMLEEAAHFITRLQSPEFFQVLQGFLARKA